jgi:small-conductance mechanosensitive channel
MNDLLTTLGRYVTPEQVLNLTRALILLAVGLLLANLLARVTRRLTAERLPQQQAELARRLVYYLTLGLFLIAGLHQLGFQLSVLLGAAGVLSVAVGFASQTSASNLVSGLFLIFEQPFQIGDIIEVGGTTGEVLAIDLLSVKLRTFDNIFVRLPNESLIKTEVRTLSRFPIRRADIRIGVDYGSNLELVRQALLEVAERNPLCLDEPAPLIIFLGFGDSSMDFQFSVWATRENYLALKNGIQEEIKAAFDERGIEIPFPHRTLYAGGQTKPLPVRIIEPHAADGSPPEPAAAAGRAEA